MNCAQAQKLIKPFLDHALPDHELAQFLDHIRTCPDCYDELGIYLAIGETLKNDDENEDPDDFNFRERLKKEITSSENMLRIHRSQAWIRRGIVLTAVLILGLLVYTGLRQMRNPERPAWETELEELSEAVTEKVTEPGAENVSEKPDQGSKEKTTEAAIEKPTETATEKAAEKSTEKTTEKKRRRRKKKN